MTAALISAGSRWRLRHGWQSQSDAAALNLCRNYLSVVGIDLVDASIDEPPDAIKLHSMEMVDALISGNQPWLDLRRVALAADWAQTLPRFVQQYMVHGDSWYGIPIGIHRANMCWVNAAVAKKSGSQPPVDVAAFLMWLDQAQRHAPAPLAIGAEPWQVGVLFESVLLAVAGPLAYLRAFVQRDPNVWREVAILDALRSLQTLRGFVDDDYLGLGWVDQLARVQRGDAAVQVMGDWARAVDSSDLLGWAVPGTGNKFVAIVDYFVPRAGDSGSTAERAAKVLTSQEFQLHFARQKGCLPALPSAWACIDLVRARLLGLRAAVLPSLTFDQCCAVTTKQSLLAVVADHFVHRRDPKATARVLAEVVG